MERERPTWSRHRDARAEAQAQRFDDISDVIISRWAASDVARVDAAWSKLYRQLPSDAVSEWLDNLASAALTDGKRWSAAFPVQRTDTEPHTPIERGAVARHRQPTGKSTPARERRAQLFRDVQRLRKSNVRQVDIANQLGISQATVSQWLRKGVPQ